MNVYEKISPKITLKLLRCRILGKIFLKSSFLQRSVAYPLKREISRPYFHQINFRKERKE